MRDIYTRTARASDIPKIDNWIRRTEENLFDADLLEYTKNISFQCAHAGFPHTIEEDPLVYMPVQNVMMLESLATKPGASDLEISKAIGCLFQAVVKAAQDGGVNEILFIGKGRITEYAERHKFPVMMKDDSLGVTLFRLKVGPRCVVTQPQFLESVM